MTAADLAIFFDFYRQNPSRRLQGFFKDISRRAVNLRLVAELARGRRVLRSLIVGCAHWANPRDLRTFLTRCRRRTGINIVALDVLPQALEEAVQRGVDFVPVLTPAQNTPFLDQHFDLLVADGLLNCCHFSQHEAIVREMYRISRPGALAILGLAHAPRRRIVTVAERAMPAHCRPLSEFRRLFSDNGFSFVERSSVETTFSRDSDVRIDNCIAQRR